MTNNMNLPTVKAQVKRTVDKHRKTLTIVGTSAATLGAAFLYGKSKASEPLVVELYQRAKDGEGHEPTPVITGHADLKKHKK